jgi:hypothetical protein
MRICSIFEDSPGHEEVSYGRPEKLRNFWEKPDPPPPPRRLRPDGQAGVLALRRPSGAWHPGAVPGGCSPAL